MKLCGITCDGWTIPGKAAAEFSLSATTVTDAAAIDGQDLIVTEDDGETVVASFAGYAVTGVYVSGDSVRLRAARELEADSKAAIEAVEANMGVLSGKVTAAEASAADAVSKAEEAKETAESAGTDLQVQAFARMAVVPMAADMTDADALTVSTLWPDWAEGVEYAAKDVVSHDGHLFRCAQAHTSSSENNTTVASLWTQIDVASDGVDVWQQPIGAHNAYSTGDRVHYPGADGDVYESLIDGNCWSPDAYPQGWSKVEDGEHGGGEDAPTETYPAFVQPTGAHDAYGIGDRVTYKGKVYESTIDGNTYAPDAYPQGWTEVEEQ